jgi:hypothetical protein
MGRATGSLLRCVCPCGTVELRPGLNNRFRCGSCRERPTRKTPAQTAAHAAVANAIRKGLLVHPTCFACADCGLPAIEYDHRDYSKPLTVDPVCRRCNLLRGPALNHCTPKRGRVALSA